MSPSNGADVAHLRHVAGSVGSSTSKTAYCNVSLVQDQRRTAKLLPPDLNIKRRQNRKGEEVGGIVPHVTLKSIANNEPAEEEVLVDRPEEDENVTRITGPFCFEATIPTPLDVEDQPRARDGTRRSRNA